MGASAAGRDEAHRAFREQERKLKSETEQEFFWRPGHVAPDRLPDPTAVIGD